MSRLGDNWATSHRNWRAIFAAIGLSIVLIWAVVLKQQDDSRTLIQTNTVTASVEEIKITQSDSRYGGKSTSYFASLILPDGKKIRFILLQAPPEIGSKVPVLIDIYDDGSKYYHYNQMDWQLLHIQ